MAFDKEKILAAAQKYADKDQHEKAIREFQKILNVEPNDVRVLLLIASSYERIGKLDEAGNSYVKIFEQYRNQGAYQKALAIIKQAQRCNPDSDDIAMSMAEVYSALGLPHEAVNQLEKCLSNAEKSQNHRTYARILQTMVRVDGENVQTRIRYAQMLQKDDDTEGAARQYSLALAQLLSKEKYIDYIQTARDYLRIAPKDAEVLQALAGIYIRMNRFSDAFAVLSVLPSSERTPEIREHFVTCFTKMGRPRDAVQELKNLAKQYEANGAREDLIESVWLRAQKMAPHDPEIIAALDDSEIPMLSDSALSLVDENGVPTRIRPENSGQAGSTPKPQTSALDRMLQSKYDEALFYYNRGNADAAQTLCLQIIAGNEQHLPALRLLAQILEQNDDLVALAQIERKIARALFETDIDEAVRHVLRAEQCTPRAWENFNLMLVFGLDPAQYGMKAPESSGVSNPRIPVAQLNASTGAQPPYASPPPLPRKSPPSVNMSPAQFTKGTPALSQPNSVPLAGAQRGHASSGVFPGAQQPARPSSGAFDGVQRHPRQSSGAFNGVSRQPGQGSGVFMGVQQHGVSDAASYPSRPQSASTPAVPPPTIAPSRPSNIPGAPPPALSRQQGNFAESPSQVGRTLSNELDNAGDGMFGDAGASLQQTAASNLSAAEPVPAWMRRSQANLGVASHVPSRHSTRATIAAPSTALETAALMSSIPNPSNPTFDQNPPSRSIAPSHAHAVGQSPSSRSISASTNHAFGQSPSSRSINPAQSRNLNQAISPRAQSSTLHPMGAQQDIPANAPPQGYGAPQPPTTAADSPARAQISPSSAQLSYISRQPSAQFSAVPKPPSALGSAETKQRSAIFPAVSPAAGIPPQDRKAVEEAIQEINFYASLMLLDDARNLLTTLIQKYGDVDIIHDAKLRISSL